MVLVIVLAVLALWAALAVALAVITGGVIHEREVHDDRPRIEPPARVAHRTRLS